MENAEKDVVVNTDDVQVAIALYGANKQIRKQCADEICRYTKGKAKRIVLSDIVQMIAQDPGVFNAPISIFAPNVFDRDFKQPIMVADRNIKRIVGKVYDMLNKEIYSFNPVKVGISGFKKVPLSNPKQLLQYIGFEVIRTVYPDFVPVMAFDKFVGKTGIYVIEDIKFRNELDLAKSKFQVVMAINLGAPVNKTEKGKIDYFLYFEDEYADSDFFRKIKPKNISEQMATVCKEIEEEVANMVKSSNLPQMPMPILIDTPRAVAGQAKMEGDAFQQGKAVFSRKEYMWTDDEVIV